MDCIQADRPIPCDLCSSRYHIVENEFPPSGDMTALPPFILPELTTKKRKSRKKADELKEKELEHAKMVFLTYEDQLYKEERLVAPHRYRPHALYFPKALLDTIVIDLLKINSQAALNVILASEEWPFIESQSSNLFDFICALQVSILSQRHSSKSKKTTKKT